MREPTEAELRAVRVDAVLERRGGVFLPRRGDRVICRKTWRNGAATGDAAVFGDDRIYVGVMWPRLMSSPVVMIPLDVGVRWSWLMPSPVVMVPLDELWFP